MLYHGTLNIVPCAIQLVLVYFIYSAVYLLILCLSPAFLF